MIIKLILFLSLFLAVQNVFCQEDFRPGYVVNQNKDTLRGFILYSEGNSKFISCYFKKNLEESATVYTPAQLVGYRLDNDAYFTVRSIKTGSNFNELFFAEILVKGRVTLFRIYERFYLEDDELKVFPLDENIQEVEKGSKKYIRNDYKYVGILNWKFSDCPEAKHKVKNTKLKERELTELFELYNSCFAQTSTSFKSQKAWSQSYVGLTGGFISTTILNSGDLASFIDESQFKNDKSIFIGLSYIFSSPRISERFSLNIDFIFQKASYQSVTSSPETRDIVALKYNLLRTPLSFSYHFINSRRKLIPFIGGGASLTLYTNLKSYWQHEQIYTNTVVIDRSESFFSYKKNTLRPFLEGGLSYNRSGNFLFSLRAQYHYGTSVIDNGLSPIVEQNFILTGSVLYKL
ncbi:MAG: outer membrane beta-barrel protein [Cyclobacteriaceae bacterium]|nr:outer membrane beta-barrel protein [Cyclobacteriaceae bacterium]